MASSAVSLLLAPPAARAGSYYATYSGGTYTYAGDDLSSPLRNDGYNPNNGGSYGPGDPGRVNSASGPITVTFLYQPDYPKTVAQDPPPSSVTIEQSCTASYNITAVMQPAASCSDGLTNPTDPEQDSFSGPVGFTAYSGVSKGIRYSWAMTDASGNATVKCSPSLQTDYGESNNDYYSTCTFTYSAVATPLYVSLSGTLEGSSSKPVYDGSGSQQILVGQGCGASIGAPPNCTIDPASYQWTISDSANTFQDWQPTTPGNSNVTPAIPANPQASYYDPGPGVQTNPTYHWYWNDLKQTQETVTCTATVVPPAGQGNPFSVTATQNVMVYVPTRSINTNMIGDGRVIQSQMKAKATSGMMNNLQEFGSSWKTSVSMPPMPVFGTGQWCYCQLITPGEYLTINGALQTSTDTTRGDGLDASFPYVSSSTDTGLEPTDGTPYSNEGDSPYL